MASRSRPAVERVQLPKAPYRVVNRLMQWLFSSPRSAQRLGRHLMLLHVTGRRTRRRFVFPVAYRDQGDGRLLVLTNSPWRANLRPDADVAVTLRGETRPARADLIEDPDTVAAGYLLRIEETGRERAGRRMGIRINVHRAPTLAELAEATRRDGLSLIHLGISGT